MEKLSQMKMKIRAAKFKLFTPGLVSLEHYCEHRIHLKKIFISLQELLVTAFSKWVLAPEIFTLHEHDQKFNLAFQLLLQPPPDLQGGQEQRWVWSSVHHLCPPRAPGKGFRWWYRASAGCALLQFPRNALALPLMAMLTGKKLNALKRGFCEHLQCTLLLQRFLLRAYPVVSYEGFLVSWGKHWGTLQKSPITHPGAAEQRKLTDPESKETLCKARTKRGFFFFIFHIRSKQIVGQKHKLASQLATSNYSSKYLRMPVDYRKQNCRDTNSPGKHVHETEEFHGRKGVCCGKVSEF